MLTQRITHLARQYGRYSYRRISIMVNRGDQGGQSWPGARIRRRERLNVPRKQRACAILLPARQVTDSTGLASNVLLYFLGATAAALALGTFLAQAIFDSGRLRSRMDIAVPRECERVENYRKSILAVLSDVETALASSSRTADQKLLLPL